MPDREKVELGIKACWFEYFLHQCCDCPYVSDRNDRKCVERLGTDALALLKEQEAVKPIAKEDDTYECICGAIVGWNELDASGIVQTRFNYCPYCGKAVKWE